MRVIISLTSYPKRINTVYPTIESLISQERAVDKIILWLCKPEFDSQETIIPYDLNILSTRTDCFEIRWVNDNLKPHKKYYYAFQEFPEDIVITVDDDVIYNKDMVGNLLESYSRHPYAISARRVRSIVKNKNGICEYKKWAVNIAVSDVERMDLLAIGVGGILYPPMCMSKSWFDIHKISIEALSQDDLWLKYNEIISRIPVVYVEDSQDIYTKESENLGLFETNINANDAVFMRLLNDIKKYDVDKWKWFQSFILDEHIYRKQMLSTYKTQFQSLFKDYEHIYIYGAGKVAAKVYRCLEVCEVSEWIDGFLVSEEQNRETLFEQRIINTRELGMKSNFLCICGVGKNLQEEVYQIMSKYTEMMWYQPSTRVVEYILRG